MKNELELARSWVAKADSDMSAAKSIIESDGPYDTACFHAQQAIEKLLKNFLAFHQHSPPKTHDLEELQRRCLREADSIDLEKFDFSEITDFAVEMRYDLEFWPVQPEAGKALEVAKRVRKVIFSSIPSLSK